MNEYHKIQSIYRRDDKGRFIIGDYSNPVFGYLKYSQWQWTEKIDGTNIRIVFKDNTVTLGGRTDAAQIPAKLLNYLKDHFTVERMASVFPDSSAGVTLFGEGYGAGIQKGGGKYLPEQKFILFDVHFGLYLERHNVDDIAKKLGIPAVPVTLLGNIEDAEKMVSQGFNSHAGDFLAEGLVGRPTVELFDRRGDRVIIKLKTKDYAELVRQVST